MIIMMIQLGYILFDCASWIWTQILDEWAFHI
jgi:hypothetical protein